MKASAAGILVSLLLSVATGRCETPEPSATGTWLGVLQVQGMKLRIALHVTRNPDDALAATLDSLDQGAKGLPIELFEQDGAEVRFEADRLKLSWSGRLDADGLAMRGEMKQGGATLPLAFERVESVAQERRSQEPDPPFPYRVEEVRFRNPRDDVELAATLTLPEREGPLPAVFLITGSGAQDRDETIAGHRPFLVLADYLARHGIAVLRADDRGVGGSAPGTPRDTSATYAQDALAAVEWLSLRPEIDKRRIGLVGHSDGANVAAMAAARSRAVSFVVMLAGVGQKGEELVLAQTALMQGTLGLDDAIVQRTASTLRQLFAALRAQPQQSKAISAMQEILDTTTDTLPTGEQAAFDRVRETLRPQLRFWTTAWFRHFLDYDPAVDLRRVRVPVLALTGALDLQVPPKENLQRIGDALRRGGNRRVTVRELPQLNHLFQTASSGLPSEYASIDETISPSALESIASWIQQRGQGG